MSSILLPEGIETCLRSSQTQTAGNHGLSWHSLTYHAGVIRERALHPYDSKSAGTPCSERIAVAAMQA